MGAVIVEIANRGMAVTGNLMYFRLSFSILENWLLSPSLEFLFFRKIGRLNLNYHFLLRRTAVEYAFFLYLCSISLY